MSDIEIIAQAKVEIAEPFIHSESDTEIDETLITKQLPKIPTKVVIANDDSDTDEEVEQEDEIKNEEEEEEEEDQDKKLLDALDSQIEKAEKQINEKKLVEEPKPKGKYDDMTFKELQALTKERNVAGRSALKNRTLIILKLQELDAQPKSEESESKITNKYETMTIPELKKMMGERNIAGRSAAKNKPSMIEKLLAYDANPEEAVSVPKEKMKKEKAPKEKEEKEEDPIDEEVNKKVAELVNKLYKIKKHAKKQTSEFKNGFMDYINDLCTLVEDYRESNNQ
jgi:hypothetical protein